MNILQALSNLPDATVAPPVQTSSPAIDPIEPDEDCEELQPFIPVLAWW